MNKSKLISQQEDNKMIQDLTNLFDLATNHLKTNARAVTDPSINSGYAFSASKGTILYTLQCEFAHLLNEVVRGPKGIKDMNIESCKRYITYIQKRYPVAAPRPA